MIPNAAADVPLPEAPASAAKEPVVVIRAGESRALNLSAAWKQRELLYFFTLRDLKLRYKQTVLGVVWTILQPLLTTGALSLFFGKLVRLDTAGYPYPLYCFAALLPWNYFAASLSRGSSSLVANGSLLNKIYFPRILIPLSAMIPAAVDTGVGLVLLLPSALYLGYLSPLAALWKLPALGALLVLASLGPSLLLSAINVRFRDITNMLPFLIQLGMFLTPVIYPGTIVSGRLKWLFDLNPMVGIVSGFRNAVLGAPLDSRALLVACLVSAVFLGAGLAAFQRMERTFADAV